MDSLNLIEDINNTQNKYINNNSDSSYTRYLELIDIYFKETNKSKFTNKFNYYVDNDGNFVKKAIDKSDDAGNMLILKPKYINIKDRLDELDKTINDMETTLRIYRSKLLDNDLSVRGEFDELKSIYLELINERDTINDFNNKENNLEQNNELILKLKLDCITLNLEQYSLFKSIKLSNEDVDLQKYLLNNEAIISNINKIKELKSQERTDFIVDELFNNNLPTKKKIIMPKKKKTPKLIVRKSSVVEPSVPEEPTIPEEPKEPKEIKVPEPLIPFKETGEEIDEVNLEEVDLSKGAVDQTDLNLGSLQSLFDDSGDEGEYMFNTKDKPVNKDDLNIPLSFGDLVEQTKDGAVATEAGASAVATESEAGSGAGAEAGASAATVEEELDLDKLSRQLNKKVKDPKIKIIKVDPNLQFTNIKCDDANTHRSNVQTTNVAGGKKRTKKGIDPELKNCIFPFKEGKGKKAVMRNECSETGIEDWCATERKEDCTANKWAYCKK